ncbi:MAG: trigger factor [Solirubrobacteraceae bacterium]
MALKTEVTELPESRVRLEVEVPPGEVRQSIDRKARELARSLRIPGFRRGKVPAPLVIQRIGREAVLEEAVHDSLAGWYVLALQETGVVPIGDPSVEVGELPPDGQSLAFSIEIGVLPKAQLGQYRGLEVGRGDAEVDDERVERELEALRERLARLETAQRAARSGDYLVIDSEGELIDEIASEQARAAAESAINGRDQLVELGTGRLLPEFEEALSGASAGEQRTVRLTLPEAELDEQDGGAEPPADRPAHPPVRATLTVSVKEVKRKELPPLDDELAIDAGFDDLDELRADIRARMTEAQERAVEAEFREAALDAAVATATLEVPEALVGARAREMWERILHSLSHRGVSREAYLKIDGRTEAELIAGLAPDAERALRREAVLSAIVAAEGIELDEHELEEALEPAAAERGQQASELLEQLHGSSRLDELREELAARKAIDLVAEQAKAIPAERMKAREQIWTPGQGTDGGGRQDAAASEGAGGGLWTPGR